MRVTIAVKAAESARRLVGATLTDSQKSALLPAYHALGDLLNPAGQNDQKDAIDKLSAKDEAREGKSEEPAAKSPAGIWAVELELLSLEGDKP